MLGGIDPIIIFQFSKKIPLVSEALAKIPLISKIPTVIEMPPVPIYLSEARTGLYIDTENKNVDISTDVETTSDGSPPAVNQKGISSTVTVTMEAIKDSIGLSLISAMIDQVFDKLTSKEYSISYLNGATTIFRGVMQSYSIAQSSQNNKMLITIEISKGEKQPQKAAPQSSVPRIDGATL